MTDDNENMEVDDILSSIKSILEEDEDDKNVNHVEVSSSSDESDAVAIDGTDDIIELSDDMRIGETGDDVAEINQVEEGSPLDLAIGDIDSDENKVSETENSSMIITEENDITVADVQDKPVDENDVNAGVENKEKIVSTNDGDEGVNFTVEQPVDTEQEPHQEDVVTDSENNESNNIEDVNAEAAETTESETGLSIEPQKEDVQKDLETNQEVAYSEVKEADVEADDAVDVSANIISNFAKMFAKGGNAEKKKVVEMPQIIGLGQGNRTLEDFVKDAIVKVIGDDIAKKWNNGADYYSMAEAEIKRQVKEWMNNNLPIMIEKIVKEEIARVIEKVGS